MLDGLYVEWIVQDNNVVVMIHFADGQVIELTKEQAKKLGTTILNVSESAPDG